MTRNPKTILKGVVRAGALPLARAVARRAVVKRLARFLLGRVPALERRIDALIGRAPPLPPRRMHVPQDSADLSPSTQMFYQELKRHFENRKP